MNLRVLIVDDQELFRDAIALTLGRDARIAEVLSSPSGADAIEKVRVRVVDVVLMDIRMPGMDGIEATRELLRMRPGVRVIVLTTFDLDDHVYEAIRAGASGFLTKDIAPADLANAVVAVASGSSAMSESATRAMLGFVRRGGADQGSRRARSAERPGAGGDTRSCDRGVERADRASAVPL